MNQSEENNQASTDLRDSQKTESCPPESETASTIERPGPPPKFRPLDTYVLVTLEEPESKTTGGIVLPEKSKEKPNSGTVVRIGSNVTQVSIEDRIYAGKYAGTAIDIDGVTYQYMKEAEIIGVFED